MINFSRFLFPSVAFFRDQSFVFFFFDPKANDTREAPKKRNMGKKLKSLPMLKPTCTMTIDVWENVLRKGMRKMSWWQWYRSYTYGSDVSVLKGSHRECVCVSHICFVLAFDFWRSLLYFASLFLTYPVVAPSSKEKRNFLCTENFPLKPKTRPAKKKKSSDKSQSHWRAFDASLCVANDFH